MITKEDMELCRKMTNKQDPNEIWETFWKPLLTDENGNLNLQAVKNELADYAFVLKQVPKVYTHVTGGRLSEPHYHSQAVISEADRYFDECFDEEIKFVEESYKEYFEELTDLLSATGMKLI
jgi:hypothetical protein